MNCGGCGRDDAQFVKAGFFKNQDNKREFFEYCNLCGEVGPLSLPDVYWDGKPEINLADGSDGKPITFISKGQKARYLKEKGICEAGDRFHGAPFTSISSRDKGQDKQARIKQFQEARTKAQAMGKDRRRQEVLRIISEARKHGL